jgi:hypothetical protein
MKNTQNKTFQQLKPAAKIGGWEAMREQASYSLHIFFIPIEIEGILRFGSGAWRSSALEGIQLMLR